MYKINFYQKQEMQKFANFKNEILSFELIHTYKLYTKIDKILSRNAIFNFFGEFK